MNSQKREELLKASISVKNAAAESFTGKIKNAVEIIWLGYKENSDHEANVPSSAYSIFPSCMTTSTGLVISLQHSDLQNSSAQNGDDGQADKWDGLEKSIVANIADNISIGIKRDTVNLVITWLL